MRTIRVFIFDTLAPLLQALALCYIIWMQYGQAQIQMPKVTPVVKLIIIASVVCFLLQLALQAMAGISLMPVLGFVPARLLDFWLWQPLTYAFLHTGIFHLLFNLLVVWTMGSELEERWGASFFTAYFFVSALGAAILYGIFSIFGIGGGPEVPVVGSSGAVYGLLMAYGVLFAERPLYFFMIFPMQARYFVMILGLVELVSSLFGSQSGGGIAHVAHLGGMVTGFFMLMAMAKWKKHQKLSKDEDFQRQKRLKSAAHLKLVEPKDGDAKGRKHWN